MNKFNRQSANAVSLRRMMARLVLTFVLALSPFLMAANISRAESVADIAMQIGNEPPLKKVQITIDEILKIVMKYPGDENKVERRAQLRTLINPVFDFEEMSRRSLGTHWKEATPDEQAEFQDVFSDLLARTYLSKIETVKPGMVKVDSESIDENKAIVKTTITVKEDSFPLDYKLQNNSGKWRVYDVIIENIGLVANYRNEFAGIIRKVKLSGLIEKLKNKEVK